MPRTPDLPCADCGKPMWRSATSAPEGQARCRPCRRVTARHGTSRYKAGCRCDICRAAKTEEMRRYVAQVIERNGISPTRKYRPARREACEVCGKPRFRKRGTPKGDKLCASCREACAVRRREAQRKAERAASGIPANLRWPWVQGNCRHCGENFARKGVASPYCSKKCGHRDRPSGAVPISRRERLAIYERDGWICQLCFEPVDRTLHYLDDWAASLDHIVPRSHMLIPDHSPQNLRLAHRWCNSVRGDETYYTAADLAA